VDLASDKRRFVAALVSSQPAALLSLLTFHGVLTPMVLAFLCSAAGPLWLARRGG
jgi:hypothetical protein